MPKRALAKRLFMLAALVLSLAVILTSCVGTPTRTEYAANYLSQYGVPDFDTSKFKVIERIYRDYYVEDIPEAEKMAEATAAVYFNSFHENIDTGDSVEVTKSLIYSYIEVVGDKYSYYRDAEEYENYDTDMSGTFYGIGVLVTYSYVDETMTVSEVYVGGGAYDAGIAAGDVIVAVDGARVSDIGYSAATNRIRGDENTTVSVTVLRGGEELTFTATRKKVVEESVTYSLDENGIGYIAITSFKENTYSQFAEAVDYMKQNGAVGMIYDLRSNPGGYLSAVVNSLAYISPRGTTIVSFSDNYDAPIKDTNSYSFELPSVVICNGSTASAGELFTAAMRDFDEVYGYFEVTTVGVTTYGKGIMQNTFSLGDGTTLTLTVAYYNPPSEKNYHGVGIEPDVVVEDAGEQLEAAYAEINKLIQNKK